MRALVVDPTRPQGVALRTDYPDPHLQPGEVLIRVHRAGICSTDLEIARGYMGFSGVLGHEFVGTVARGPETLVGRRVVAEINCVPPGSRSATDAQRKHDPDRTTLGIFRRDGAFADFTCVPIENCHVVPASVSDQQAVFVEPLAAAVQVTIDCPVTAKMRVVVIGPGRLGLLCGQVLAWAGCRPDVIGRSPASLALARRLGLRALDVADVRPAADADLVVECTGAPEGLGLAARIVRPRGTIVLKSTYAGDARVDLAPLVIHEIRVLGSRCGPFAPALDLLARRQVAVDELLAGVFDFDRAEEAFAAAGRPGTLKVQLDVARDGRSGTPME